MVKINKILEKEMTRREFLAKTGGALLALTTLPTILGSLAQDEKQPENTDRPGYGISSYGP